jgi:peptidoglycan-N-acetylglucosamine deacetylase
VTLVLDRLKTAGGKSLDRLKENERLRKLGGEIKDRSRRGRDRLKGSRGAQAAAARLGQIRETPAGQYAAGRWERLKEYGDEHPVARRRLLTGVPSMAGLALVAGTADAMIPSAKPASPPPPPAAHAIVRPRPAPPTEKAHVADLPVQRKPIFTLSDYRRMTGAPAFPSDAIALTIDDGPHPVWTPKILRLLDKYHVPAMFCMIGNQVLGHEDVARMVTKAGHQLANHTWSHPTELTHKPREQVRKEIERAQAKIKKTTGHAPKLFRSPGGDWSPAVLQETARAGLIPLDWSDDPRDWSKPGVAHIKGKLMAARPGQILLCHDGGGDRSQTYAALSAVIPALSAKGLRFVAL